MSYVQDKTGQRGCFHINTMEMKSYLPNKSKVKTETYNFMYVPEVLRLPCNKADAVKAVIPKGDKF